jgi:hypothetical protein
MKGTERGVILKMDRDSIQWVYELDSSDLGRK